MILPGLTLTNDDLRVARQQLSDEGREMTPLIEEEFKELDVVRMTEDPSAQTRAQALLDMAAGLPVREDYPYQEPNDLTGIRASRPEGRAALVSGGRRFDHGLSEEDLSDRVLGAWLGRCSGCLLGKPVEGWRSSILWPYLKELGAYPLSDYLRSDAPEELAQKFHIPRDRAYVDRAPHMIEDDDTNYTVAGLAILERYGPGVTSADVANFWLENIPILHTFNAERVAYRNLTGLVPPPNSGSYRNPYREWNGATTRADLWGYAAVGNPELAAEFAWRDASISHARNGIYGEMWAAAMLAGAPFAKDAREVIEIGLGEIPAKSRLAEAVRSVTGWREEGIDYEEAVGRVHARWDETFSHHWGHAIPNAQIVALVLLWGEDDFGKTICRAVQACFDTDGNGATSGSIFGMMHGAQSLPEKWTAPLKDELETGVVGFPRVKLSELASRTVSQYSRLKHKGHKESTKNTKEEIISERKKRLKKK